MDALQPHLLQGLAGISWARGVWGVSEMHRNQAWPLTVRSGQVCKSKGDGEPMPPCARCPLSLCSFEGPILPSVMGEWVDTDSDLLWGYCDSGMGSSFVAGTGQG